MRLLLGGTERGCSLDEPGRIKDRNGVRTAARSPRACERRAARRRRSLARPLADARARDEKRGSRELRSLVIAGLRPASNRNPKDSGDITGNRRFPVSSQNAPRSGHITKDAGGVFRTTAQRASVTKRLRFVSPPEISDFRRCRRLGRFEGGCGGWGFLAVVSTPAVSRSDTRTHNRKKG